MRTIIIKYDFMNLPLTINQMSLPLCSEEDYKTTKTLSPMVTFRKEVPSPILST